MSDYILKLENICKSFAGVHALNNAAFRLRRGEIHALIGENGAGKSTLVKIIAGAEQKDSGHIWLEGKEVNITSPRMGKELGITVIYQEFYLAPHLSVAENIFIDRLSGGKSGKLIDWKRLNEDASILLKQIGFDNIDPETRVSDLKVAYQQIVEICKALSKNSKILILDEPTAVLTFKEKEKLFELLLRLKAQGVSIIYISHRLNELFEISDHITVFKDGSVVNELKTSETNENELPGMMIGREIKTMFPIRDVKIGEEILRVEGLRRSNAVQDVSFSVSAGEIVGFSGLVGAGRTETMRLVYGADKKDSGRIYLNRQAVNIRSIHAAVKNGLGLLPEDRKRQGIILDMKIRENVSLASLKNVESYRLINKKKEVALGDNLIDYLKIKLGTMEDNVSTLSGGNQQKVSFAKWIAARCKCIILDEPTRGVDVGAKSEIYKIISQMAEEGVAVIVISSEMFELIGLCDRVYVMREGRIVGELAEGELSEQALINLAMGVKYDGKN